MRGELFNPQAFVRSFLKGAGEGERPVLLVLGAIAAGAIDPTQHPHIDKPVSISEYPLSGACAINRICGAIGSNWGIVRERRRRGGG